MKALTAAYRRESLKLRAGTIRSMQAVWPALDWNRLDDTFPAWLAATSGLVERDHAKAAQMAGLYVEALRRAEKAAGSAEVVTATLGPERVSTALRVTSLVALKRSATAGVPATTAKAHAFVQASGAATRLVLDGGRDTIRETLASDPEAAGWTRVIGGQGCSFCMMLAGRGAVYSADTADFASHDHCMCMAEPVFGDAVNVKEYTPSQKFKEQGARDANNKALRKYLATL